jgi:hypothetical protein
MQTKINPFTSKQDVVRSKCELDRDYVNHGTDGEGTEELDYIDFDVTATSGAKVGRLRWNATDRCLEYDSYIDGSTVTNQIGQEVWVRARNNTGSAIANGKAVYITGALGNRPTIALADMSVHSNYTSFMGITTESIANNEDGFVTTIGSVRGLNTNAFAEGDKIFVSATTPGELVNVRPDPPNHIISIGTVTVKNPSIGEIAVKIEKQQIAKDVPIADGGDIITATDVEAALQENRTAIDLNTTHRGSNGSDHSYINQDVTTTGTPTFGETLFTDKVKFTQTDGNEYIDSLADGYLDLAATTGIRLTSPLTRITGDLYLGNNVAADPAIVFDGSANDGQISFDESADEFILSSPVNSLIVGAGGFGIEEIGGGNVLVIAPTSNLTATRILGLATGDASRIITFTGNPTLDDWFDQSVKTTASPTFANVYVPDGGFTGVSGAVGLTYSSTDTDITANAPIRTEPASGNARFSATAATTNDNVAYSLVRDTTVDGFLASAGAASNWSDISVQGDLVLRADEANLILTVRNASGDIVFASGAADTERMRLTNAGYLGIGTTSPSDLLHVFRDTNGTAYVRAQNTNAVGTSSLAALRAIASTADVVIVSHGAARTATRYGITVGNYSEVLTLDGEGLLIGTGSLAKPVIFGTNNTERMRIASDGYVGIGTVSPSAKLHIDQASTTAAVPALIVDQADVSEGTINFIASARGVITGATNSVQSVRVELNGTVYRLALYANA